MSSAAQGYVVHAWSDLKSAQLHHMLLVEAVGTFLINFAVSMHVKSDLHLEIQPLAVAATITLVVAIGAPISGAHYNPNLTLGFYVAGDRKSPQPLIYVFVQLLSALAAGFLAYGLDGYAGGLPSAGGDTGQWAKVAFAEWFGALLTILVILYVAKIASPPLGNTGPILVGLVFYAAIMTLKGVSGAVLNPSLALNLWVVALVAGKQSDAFATLVTYVAFNLLGGFVAGILARRLLALKADGGQLSQPFLSERSPLAEPPLPNI